MKKVILAATALCLVALLSMTALAQPGGGRGPGGPGGPGGPPGGPGGFGGPGGMGIEGLLRNETLRNEMNLSEEQVTKLRAIAEEGRESMRQRMPRRSEGGGPPPREEIEKMQAEMAQHRELIEGKVKQILTAEQQEKMAKLRFQLSGGLESRNLDVRSMEVLNLSAEQLEKVKAIEEERRAEFRAFMEKRGPVDWRNPQEREKLGEEMRTLGEEMRKKYTGKITAVLTAEQKGKAETLTTEGKELREKLGFDRGPRGGRGEGRRGGGEYRPGDDSWQPGQGGGQGRQREGKPRRAFPQSE